ncbi:hypothetical protein Tco_0067889, partial [Tanacetum coccineum]
MSTQKRCQRHRCLQETDHKSISKTPTTKTEIKLEKSKEKPVKAHVREEDKACNEQSNRSASANHVEAKGQIEVTTTPVLRNVGAIFR